MSIDEEKNCMADEAVKSVRQWLQLQPFSMRMLTLILFMVENIESEFGKEVSRTFENELREACRKLPRFP